MTITMAGKSYFPPTSCYVLYPFSLKSIAICILLLLINKCTAQPGYTDTSGPGIGYRTSPRVIRTEQGRIRGTITSPGVGLPDVEVYRGLQYASTLRGELRFMPPTSPTDRWSGVQIAVTFKPVCPQKIPDVDALRKSGPHAKAEHIQRLIPFLQDQSEDCLYLNVYVPTTVANSSTPLAVIVFIHAENYELGAGNAYDASVLAASGNVIVVTLNFRLGPFGFLSRGDGNAQGNYALLDIVAALHYIRSNIAGFGGDPSKVTLLGQGHGGAIISLLLVSPVTRSMGGRLFDRAIIMSGSALSSWALSTDPLRMSQELSRAVNCSAFWDTSPLLLQCLKNRTESELLNANLTYPRYTSGWGPIIDRRSVLETDPRTLIEEGESNFGSTDLLIGVVNSEGLQFLTQDELESGISELRKIQMIRTYVRNVYSYHRQTLYDIIWHEYTDYEQMENVAIQREQIIQLLGDAEYIAPAIELADYHQHFTASTFLYSFHYPSHSSGGYPRWAGGVHGEDLPFVLGAPLASVALSPFSGQYTESEKLLSRAMIAYWTNFAKTGNPNRGFEGGERSADRFLAGDWPPYELQRQQYLHIDENRGGFAQGVRPTIRHHLQGTKMALWLELLPKIHQDPAGLEEKYHLLDNYNNLSLFDPTGVRPVSYKAMLIPAPITPPLPPSTLLPTLAATTGNIPMQMPTRNQEKDNAYVAVTRKRYIPTVAQPKPKDTASGIGVGEAVKEDSKTGKTAKLPLTVTVGVGVSLLFLNLLVLVAVYYQKDRIRQERKAHERAINGDQGTNMLEHPAATGSDSEDSGSYYAHGSPSPPLSPPPASLSSSEHVVRTRVSPLQCHSPVSGNTLVPAGSKSANHSPCSSCLQQQQHQPECPLHNHVFMHSYPQGTTPKSFSHTLPHSGNHTMNQTQHTNNAHTLTNEQTIPRSQHQIQQQNHAPNQIYDQHGLIGNNRQPNHISMTHSNSNRHGGTSPYSQMGGSSSSSPHEQNVSSPDSRLSQPSTMV